MSEGRATTKTTVFISYARRDKDWLERLKVHLSPLFRKGHLSFWEDTQLEAGKNWMEEIERNLCTAKVGVLLISANFLASEFIWDKELRELRRLDNQKTKDGEKCGLIPVIVEPSILQEMRSRNAPVVDETLQWLADLQWEVASESRPLLCLPQDEQEVALARVAFDIFEAASSARTVADLGRKADGAATTEKDQVERAEKQSTLMSLLSEYERDHLRKLDENPPPPFQYVWRHSFEQELGRLFLLRFIDRQPDRGFRTAMRDQGPSNDLHQHFHITKLGRDYLDGL